MEEKQSAKEETIDIMQLAKILLVQMLTSEIGALVVILTTVQVETSKINLLAMPCFIMISPMLNSDIKLLVACILKKNLSDCKTKRLVVSYQTNPIENLYIKL